MKNLFIVVDGIDGSGKSEIVKMLHNYLFSKNKKFRILTTREPTNGTYGKQMREMLTKENDPLSSKEKLLDLFIKDRKEHLEKTIEPFLNSANDHELNIVLCDRYYYSTIAFQSAQGFNTYDLIKKNKDFRQPNLSIILDVDPNIALERIRYRQKEKFEQIDFMRKIRENFLELPRLLKDNIKIIDSSKTLKDSFDKIKEYLDDISPKS